MICTLKLVDFRSSLCCSISGHRHGRAAYKGMVWNYKESRFCVKWRHDLRTHDGVYVSGDRHGCETHKGMVRFYIESHLPGFCSECFRRLKQKRGTADELAKA